MSYLRSLIAAAPRGYLLLSCIAALNIVLAFAREASIAYLFGMTAEVDAFMVAITLPRLLVISAVSLSVAVVLPVYVGYRESGRMAEASALIGGWLRLSLAVTGVVGLVILVFAEPITRIMAPGMAGPHLTLAAGWLRWLTLYLVVGVVGGGCKIVLDAHRRFAWPQLAPALVSIGVVVSAHTLHLRLGLSSLALGFVAGGAVGLAMQCWRAAEVETGVLTILRPVGIKLPLAAAGVILLQESVGRLNPLVDRFFASTLPTGSISALGYAEALNAVPNAVITASLATALFPVLARLAARGEVNRAIAVTRRWITVFVFAGLGPTALIVLFRHEIVSLAFERGLFDAQATALTASVLAVLPAMMILSAVSTLLVRLLLVQQRQGLILALTFVGLAIKLTLSVLLVERWGLVGLVGATVIASLLATSARFVFACRAAN